MRILGREPAMVVATVVALLQAVSLFFNFTTDAQGAVNAALVAVGGIVAAAMVSVDGALPLLVGVGKAVVALLLAFGLDVPANVQVGVMAVLTVLAGLAVRTQVSAPVAAPPDSAMLRWQASMKDWRGTTNIPTSGTTNINTSGS